MSRWLDPGRVTYSKAKNSVATNAGKSSSGCYNSNDNRKLLVATVNKRVVKWGLRGGGEEKQDPLGERGKV